jgi:SPP1 family predicted phage head-tail adaptor
LNTDFIYTRRLRVANSFNAKAGQNNSEMTHTIRGHWKSGVTNKMRLVTGSRTFEVLAAMNWGERNEELRIMAKEIL